MWRLLTVVVPLLGVPVLASAQSIEGAWRQVELETRGGPNSGTVSTESRGALWVFTDRYHSLNAPNADVRANPGASPTDQQLAQLFRTYVAFAGTYELDGSELTLHREASLNPAEASPLSRDITLTATTLETRQTDPDGVVIVRRYVRVD